MGVRVFSGLSNRCLRCQVNLRIRTKYFPLITTSGSDGRDDRHLMSFAGQFAFFTYIRPVYMNRRDSVLMA